MQKIHAGEEMQEKRGQQRIRCPLFIWTADPQPFRKPYDFLIAVGAHRREGEGLLLVYEGLDSIVEINR